MHPPRLRCAQQVVVRRFPDAVLPNSIRRKYQFSALVSRLFGFVVAAELIGCSGLDPVTTYEQITDPTQLFMALTIDHPAVTLAPAAAYDTLQLTATPRNALGEPMTNLPAPAFRLSQETDSTLVTVTPTGLLTAKSATETPVLVLAELRTGDNVLRVDSAYVVVTADAPPVLTDFSIDALPPDSTVWFIPSPTGGIYGLRPPLYLSAAGLLPDLDFDRGGYSPVSPRALDAGGNLIAGLTVEYASLDPTIATVDRWLGLGTGIHPGQARVVARTTAYGVSKADTTIYTVRWPRWHTIGIPLPFQPTDAKIVPNGYVFWLNGEQPGLPAVNVTFDDPTKVASPPDALCGVMTILLHAADEYCGTGDFVLPTRSVANPFRGSRVRQFPVPGIYPYHTSTGISGRIIVTDTP